MTVDIPAAGPTPAHAIEAYIRGKDGNRPHLLAQAFTDTALLRMQVRTEAIAFPPESTGREAIAETLVRRFNQTWENIYTLCIGAPPAPDAEAFSCDWLVAMSAKQDASVRVGCGRYDWIFDGATRRARSLVITIDAMETLAWDAAAAMRWAGALDYPWCERGALLATMAPLPPLQGIAARLRAAR